MKDGQNYLLLRYSTGTVKDCIKLHKEVLAEKGYCWFGKIGNVPSAHILQQVFDESQPVLVLYRKNAAFICNVKKYSMRTPQDGVPRYYQDEGIFPSVFFCLESIEPCDASLFHDSVVVSTGAYVEDVIFHSRIPFMLCKYVDESKLQPLGTNDCRYKKDGFCTCRTCVNYDCLCERPSSCAKQRR